MDGGGQMRWQSAALMALQEATGQFSFVFFSSSWTLVNMDHDPLGD
jgi:hypothetical protein